MNDLCDTFFTECRLYAWCVVLRLIALLLFGTWPSTTLGATLTIEPLRGLADQPFTVRIAGAQAGARVRVQAAFTDNEQTTWTAFAAYFADTTGKVDTSTATAVEGTYRGILPGGLTCSMLPVAQDNLPQYLASMRERPGRTMPAFGRSDSATFMITAQVDGATLGPIEIVREYQSFGVTVSEVDAGPVQGLYFEPPSGMPRGIPVVVLGGSGGGIQRADAALLASRGHPSLALAYFGYRGLPEGLVEIPLETFAKGAAWLKAKVGAAGVVLMGGSRGSEAVQLTAAYLPDDIAAIIAITPSPLVHGSFGKGAESGRAAWTLGGRPITPVQSGTISDMQQREMQETQQLQGRQPPGVASTPDFLRHWADPIAHSLHGIPVERIRVPVLLLGGEDDAIWPSGLGARQIRDRMTAHGKPHLVEAYTYAGAGHLISRPGTGSEISSFLMHSMTKLWISVGGRPEANCRASYDTWARIRDFLHRLTMRRQTATHRKLQFELP